MELRPYQREAVEAITAGLASGGKGQLHAACGSGKTIMSIASADELVPGDGLMVVLAPSLSLVAQLVSAWRSLSHVDAVLAVCSDDTVIDAPVRLEDIDARVTTDALEIEEWLGRTEGRRLVVGTYQSSERLSQALRLHGHPVDLAVFDEAHHLAGRSEHATKRVLDDDVLPARRRLFMTATPRVDEVRVEMTLGQVSMADTTVFGPVLYEYSWARAISEKHLDDYRVVVIGVTRKQLVSVLTDERFLVDRPGDPELRVLAAQAVIGQAAHQYGLRRIIAFSARLDAAAEFARTMSSTLLRLPADSRPAGPVHTAQITGDMGHRQREEILGSLRTPPGGPDGWTVVTNVRCLSEGVDVPAVDAVAFTHPKRSQVDIVQAVGRALRRSGSGQGVATVIVPIVVPDSTEDTTDLDPGDFQVLWQVLRALRSHDESLGIELDSHASKPSENSPELPARIMVHLPRGTSDDVLRGVKALTIQKVTSAWWTGFGHARTYWEEHGHLEAPSGYVTEDGTKLGQWIVNARQHYRKGWLSPTRITALEEIGMVWDTTDLPWARMRAELRAFRDQYGHALVPQAYVAPSGYALGSKVNVTRGRAHRVPDGVRAALNDLGMVWDTRDLAWQELFTACQAYAQKYGHLSVPGPYETPEGYRLGARMKRYRMKWEQGTIDPAELASLEELGWCPEAGGRAGAWAAFQAAARRYVAEHGSLRDVRKDYVDAQGYNLGKSIQYYRNLKNGTKKKGGKLTALPPERVEFLDSLGMSWKSVWDTAKKGKRGLTPAEAETLAELPPTEQGREIIRLVDEGEVTHVSIAKATGMNPTYFSTKLKNYRETGTWATRSRGRSSLPEPRRTAVPEKQPSAL